MIKLLKNHKYWLALAVLIGAGLVAASVITKIFNAPINHDTYIGIFLSLIVAAVFSAALLKFQSKNLRSNIDIYLATFLSFTTALAIALHSSYYSPCNTSPIYSWTDQLFINAFEGLVVVTIISVVRHRIVVHSRQFSLLIISFLLWLIFFLVIGGNAQCDARDARRIADINQLQLALELYKNADTNGSYPAALANLVPTYIGGVPKDPKTGIAYEYATITASGVVTNYHLGTVLEHKENKALCTDADFNSAALGWVNGFNGSGNDPNNFCNGKPNGDANPAIYDVTSER